MTMTSCPPAFIPEAGNPDPWAGPAFAGDVQAGDVVLFCEDPLVVVWAWELHVKEWGMSSQPGAHLAHWHAYHAVTGQAQNVVVGRWQRVHRYGRMDPDRARREHPAIFG